MVNEQLIINSSKCVRHAASVFGQRSLIANYVGRDNFEFAES
jgi:hypothetical protein